MSEQIEFEVRVNSEEAGRIRVDGASSKREKELAALALPEVQRRIGEATIKSFAIIDDGVINIVA